MEIEKESRKLSPHVVPPRMAQDVRDGVRPTGQVETRSKSKLHLFRSVWFWIACVVALLVVGRALLPWIVKDYLNKKLDNIGGFHGSVTDVKLAILHGSYEVDGLRLVKINERTGGKQEPVLSVEAIGIALDWDALLDRRIVSSIKIWRPIFIFNNVAAAETVASAKREAAEKESEKKAEGKKDVPWQKQIEGLYPFDINQLIIADGEMHFRDLTSKPQINVNVSAIDLQVENISNSLRSASRLPTDVKFSARLMRSGVVKMTAKTNWLIDPPEVDLKAEVRAFKLTEINDFARAYGDFDFKNGDFDLTAELVASKTRYEGYVKTLAKNIELLNWKEERAQGKSVKHLLWEGLLASIVDIFKNHHRNQFAARIPLSGPRSDLKIDKWATVGSILRNGFVRALSPQFEDDVKFSDVSHASGPAGQRAPPNPKP